MFAAAEGGRAGAVTDRLTLIPNGRGAGAEVGVSEDCRRETIMELSPCWACGRTGNGRRKGFGVADRRRWALAVGDGAEYEIAD